MSSTGAYPAVRSVPWLVNDSSSLPALLSVQEACELLRVSAKFLRRLHARGLLQLVRMGRKVLVPRDEVQRLMRDGAPPE